MYSTGLERTRRNGGGPLQVHRKFCDLARVTARRAATDAPNYPTMADDPGPSGTARSVCAALTFDAALYCCGRFVVAPYVLRGCSSVPRRLFAASFSLSLALLTLVLVEVLGMLTASARLFLWRLHLALHLFLLVILLPLVQFALLLRRKLRLSQGLAYGLALAPLAAWLQLFYRLGDIFPMVASEAELEGESLLYRPALRTLGTAGVIGVSVMAVLSGWSSVVSPTSSISRLLAPVAESDLRAAERSVLCTLQILLRQRQTLALVRRQQQAALPAGRLPCNHLC